MSTPALNPVAEYDLGRADVEAAYERLRARRAELMAQLERDLAPLAHDLRAARTRQNAIVQQTRAALFEQPLETRHALLHRFKRAADPSEPCCVFAGWKQIEGSPFMQWTCPLHDERIACPHNDHSGYGRQGAEFDR